MTPVWGVRAAQPSRRDAVLGMAVLGFGLAPRYVQASVPSSTDVVVVGAGMAGIAAAQALAAAGKKVAVLEARSRIGGRVFTDTASFGFPVDFGATFLRSAEDNPLVAEAKARRWPISKDEGDFWVYSGNADASQLDYDSLGNDIDAIDRAITEARQAQADQPLAARARLRSRWSDVVRALAGPVLVGADYGMLSALDAPRIIGTGNDMVVPGGMAQLLAQMSRNLSITTGAVVNHVRWERDQVKVGSSAGEVSARAVIVTLPPVLLQKPPSAGGIVFEPGLPNWKMEALERLPSGLVDRVALHFENPDFGAAANTQVNYYATGREIMSFRLMALGQPIVIAQFGGAFARELEEQGEDALIQAARVRLKSIFGNKADSNFKKGRAVLWGQDRLSLGSHTYARIGQSGARKLYAQPLEGRLFFAGDGAPGEWAGQLPGAYQSGRDTAALVAAALK